MWREKNFLHPENIDYDKCNELIHMIKDKDIGILLPGKDG